jgi:hypothetical protein
MILGEGQEKLKTDGRTGLTGRRGTGGGGGVLCSADTGHHPFLGKVPHPLLCAGLRAADRKLTDSDKPTLSNLLCHFYSTYTIYKCGSGPRVGDTYYKWLLSLLRKKKPLKASRLTLYTKHINTLCGQNVELLSFEPGGTYSEVCSYLITSTVTTDQQKP